MATGLGAALTPAGPAKAEFAAAISPPRFEVAVAAGLVTRQVLEIAHAGASPGSYRIYTADWTLGPAGEIGFSDALHPGSCRPWVALERRMVTIAPAAKLRFRFEITPPADTAPTECRFALMVESAEAAAGTGAANFPLSGRIAVIVYARVGGVKPELRIDAMLTTQQDGRRLPALRVTNHGAATGRFVGFLSGQDAGGRYVDLAPDSIPLLPGMTRIVALAPVPAIDRPDSLPPPITAWPLRVKGTLEVDGQDGGKLPLDISFTAP